MKLTRKENCYEVESNGYFYRIEKAEDQKAYKGLYEIQVTKNGRSEWLISLWSLKQVRGSIENGDVATEYEGLCECIDNGSIYDNFD